LRHEIEKTPQPFNDQNQGQGAMRDSSAAPLSHPGEPPDVLPTPCKKGILDGFGDFAENQGKSMAIIHYYRKRTSWRDTIQVYAMSRGSLVI